MALGLSGMYQQPQKRRLMGLGETPMPEALPGLDTGAPIFDVPKGAGYDLSGQAGFAPKSMDLAGFKPTTAPATGLASYANRPSTQGLTAAGGWSMGNAAPSYTVDPAAAAAGAQRAATVEKLGGLTQQLLDRQNPYSEEARQRELVGAHSQATQDYASKLRQLQAGQGNRGIAGLGASGAERAALEGAHAAGLYQVDRQVNQDFLQRGSQWDSDRTQQAATLLGATADINRQDQMTPYEQQQMSAGIKNMLAQGRLTAAQAQQAEEIARNQGSIAAANFIIQLVGAASGAVRASAGGV